MKRWTKACLETAALTLALTACAPLARTAVPGHSEDASDAPANGTRTGMTANVTQASIPAVIPGWRYIDLTPVFGGDAQIVGLQPRESVLTVTASYDTSSAGDIVYQSAPLDLRTWKFSSQGVPAEQPAKYTGPWTLRFGPVNRHKPVQITLVHDGKPAFSLPSSIPGYASLINPAGEDPGSYDNRILGQTGPWLWLAMKGPENPPIPELLWGYRVWDRIVAVNVQTQQVCVFPIPKSTSPVSTWDVTPAFAERNGIVYVGTGSWLGLLPANPTATSKVDVIQAEPASIRQQDETAMLNALQERVTSAADGLALMWNHFVMQGNTKTILDSWIFDPVWLVHGTLPQDIIWALDFPLQEDSAAYQKRAKLVADLEALLHNPLPSAWVALSEPAKLRSYFHATPPTPLPGYTIRQGYYVKIDS
ncbi:hypothetical protein [Alicyclobacillus macrosporangiidus]|uniref:Uncharacterized protein n=1 Tax=Alicyclobacillus macrosporangiidus TaxID=392015 RepID=A0A1I7KGZ1_9BACL|nr:hypothetical protein [Alicyclobacillus macrosporangiidus]SFU96690.1 hypothetical protein SAMN05421543_1165 [Alicyclobacillus macrosporangiidus]